MPYNKVFGRSKMLIYQNILPLKLFDYLACEKLLQVLNV